VKSLCRAFGITRSGFYAWKKRPASASSKSDAQLTVRVSAAHRRNRGIYGSPRIHRKLQAQGVRVGRKRIERVMRENGLKRRRKRTFCCTTDSRHALPIAANVLDRKFNPAAANLVWAGDVTYIRTDEGWLYLAVILDLFSRRVVGSVSATNDRDLALEALKRALQVRRPRPGLLHHKDPRKSLRERRRLKRTVRKRHHGKHEPDCYDNAVAKASSEASRPSTHAKSIQLDPWQPPASAIPSRTFTILNADNSRLGCVTPLSSN